MSVGDGHASHDTSMISVVIVTYNSEACIGACIDALARWLPDTEQLVIDNASADSSRAVARHHGATVVELHENIGFGRACNIGAERAEHDHILFLNPDVAIRSADADGVAELLGVTDLGLIVPTSTNSRFTFAERSWMGETLSLTLGALWPREVSRYTPSTPGGRALWVSGAALLVRKTEFVDLGGFDARYFLYYEDRDLSHRYRHRDLPLRTTPAIVADHVGGGSSELDDRRSNIIAFAMMGWIQYMHTVRGPDAAARAWKLAHAINVAIMRSVGGAARVAPSVRLRRKDMQLKEVMQTLKGICASSGTLEQSDDHAYWPDAVAVLGETWRAAEGPAAP